MTPDKEIKRTQLTIDVALAPTKDRQQADVRVYLFDAAGRLIQSQPAKDTVQFSIDPTQRYRVTVGPNLMQQDKAPADLGSRLLSASAISQDYSPREPVTKLSFSIRDTLILGWLFVCMNIHGRVRKHLNPGESPAAYAPICMGIVEIFVIDLACSLARLSDAQLLTIRNQTLAHVPPPPPALAGPLSVLTGNPLRAFIAAHRADLAHYMCNLIPEWAICYRQLPNATIQSDGTFSLDYCFFFWEAPPDLYFEVKQTIDGVEIEVADPDIMCTTMWGYDGSVSALITVEDPRAVACVPTGPDLGLLYVWPTAIGNTELWRVNGLRSGVGAQLGLLPDGPWGTPWGGTLPLQVLFDPNLRANNIWYYRWSYQFQGYEFEGWHPISAAVTHRWMEIVGMNIKLHPILLGPHPVGTETNLFEIPNPSLPWVNIVDYLDRPSAYFDSTVGESPGRSGIVTLKLQLFTNLGVHVACANDGHGGLFTFELPNVPPSPFDASPATGVHNIDGNGDLIFKLHVDNNRTVAELPLSGVQVSGHAADVCGMLHYGTSADTATIAYSATHPHNFLWWGLSLIRGATPLPALGLHGEDNVNPPWSHPASDLLGTCPQAAFAASLVTRARATNGYGRQSQYDDSATIAFALVHP